MFGWITRLLGFGPVARAISARLRARIKAAEEEFAAKARDLQSTLEADIKVLRLNHERNEAATLDTIIDRTIKG